MNHVITADLMHFLETAWIPIVEVLAGAVIGPKVKKAIVIFANKSSNAQNKGVLTFVGSAANICIIALSLILAAEALGLKMNSIISLFTALGLGVALALKGNMANVAGGLQILITKPFKIGDYIRISSHYGVVTAIELMFTTIRTNNQKEVVIPNATIVQDLVTNFSKNPYIRLKIPFAVSNGSNFTEIEQIVLRILKESPHVLQKEENEVTVRSIEDGYIVMEAIASIEPRDQDNCKRAILKEIALSIPGLQTSSPTKIELEPDPDAALPASAKPADSEKTSPAKSVVQAESSMNQTAAPAGLQIPAQALYPEIVEDFESDVTQKDISSLSPSGKNSSPASSVSSDSVTKDSPGRSADPSTESGSAISAKQNNSTQK